MVNRDSTTDFFGWVSPRRSPPKDWDLRQTGWELCHGKHGCRAECRHVLICEVSSLTAAQRLALAESDRPAWRLIMLGVEDPAERAELLNRGCAEALPADTDIFELQARAHRVTNMFGMLPRWRDIGPLTLDLFHRDARLGTAWLNLHPREFGVLWRFADTPGAWVTKQQLLQDVWRLSYEPETNSVEVHVSRLRAKLAAAGCGKLVQTARKEGYRLADTKPHRPKPDSFEKDALDRYLFNLGWMQLPEIAASED